MPLTIVSIPIGHPDDISKRALTTLSNCQILIGEERKIASQLLRAHGLSGKRLELLNEHSTDEEVKALSVLCEHEEVALISDCGTPVFCDPGARLISQCRKKNISVTTNPGASSLMSLLALSSVPLPQFVFRGFLPAETEARQQALRNLQKEKQAIVLMDTPYRLRKLLGEMRQFFADRKMLLGVNLTSENEQIIEGQPAHLENQLKETKAEFVLLIYPQ